MRWADRLALAVMALAVAATIAGAAQRPVAAVNDAAIVDAGFPPKLSAFGLFADLPARTPAARVLPYRLNSELFSDYTKKQRYVYVPAGQAARYDAEEVFAFPVGSALVKTFGYGEGAAFRPIETRLLLHRASGWIALPYVWDADGRDATLRRAGTRVPAEFVDPRGERRQISYAVPNQNQCKGCHAIDGELVPIGPKARNLNDGEQLGRWQAAGLLDRAPADAPALVRWTDAAASLEERATAYLEINCAHCHNDRGPASNSGLFFDWRQADPAARGIGKRPVAAGRGSGGRAFTIDPGNPDNSILLYRMASTDPGVAMPELGRATADAEAIAMLHAWIAGMKPTRN